MLIFVENITNRLRYTFDFIFKERDLTYEFTTNKESFINSEVSKFNYSRASFDKEIKSLTPSSELLTSPKHPSTPSASAKTCGTAFSRILQPW